MWRIFLFLCVFFSHETLVAKIWDWSAGQERVECCKECRKKLRPMKNRFDSRKHSTQTLDRLYSCSYKQFVLATLHSDYPSYEKPLTAQPYFSFLRKHTQTPKECSSSKKKEETTHPREREQIKLLNPLQKFMDEMTTFLLFCEWE